MSVNPDFVWEFYDEETGNFYSVSKHPEIVYWSVVDYVAKNPEEVQNIMDEYSYFDNADFAADCIERNFNVYFCLNEKYMRNKYLALCAMDQDPDDFDFLPYELRNDKEFVKEFFEIEGARGCHLVCAGEEVRQDPEFIKLCYEDTLRFYKRAFPEHVVEMSEEMREEKEICEKIIKEGERLLKSSHER